MRLYNANNELTDNAKPTEYNGVLYVSRRELAAHLGIHVSTYYRRLRNNVPVDKPLTRKGHIVEYQGITYPSKAALYRAIGMSNATYYRKVRKGSLLVNLPKRLPVKIRGVVYKDAHTAADALGVKIHTVYSALARGRIDFVGLGHRQKQRGEWLDTSKAVTIAGKKFPSITALATYVGLSQSYVSKILLHGVEEAKERLTVKVLHKVVKEDQLARKARLHPR